MHAWKGSVPGGIRYLCCHYSEAQSLFGSFLFLICSAVAASTGKVRQVIDMRRGKTRRSCPIYQLALSMADGFQPSPEDSLLYYRTCLPGSVYD